MGSLMPPTRSSTAIVTDGERVARSTGTPEKDRGETTRDSMISAQTAAGWA
jgi:hypothetical protein